MVHALKKTHSLLQPGGLLINVHDMSVPHVIEVHSAQTVTKAGWLLDSEDFDNERLAFNALAQVVLDNDFVLEDEREFNYNIHIDDVEELQEWLAEWWETALLPEGTVQRLNDILRQVHQKAHIVLRAPTRMTKLRAT